MILTLGGDQIVSSLMFVHPVVAQELKDKPTDRIALYDIDRYYKAGVDNPWHECRVWSEMIFHGPRSDLTVCRNHFSLLLVSDECLIYSPLIVVSIKNAKICFINNRINSRLQMVKIRRQIIPKSLNRRFWCRFSRRQSCLCALLSKCILPNIKHKTTFKKKAQEYIQGRG